MADILNLTKNQLQLIEFLSTVDFPGDVTIAGDLTVTGSSNIGVDETVTGDFQVDGDMTIGDADTDALTVNATSNFQAAGLIDVDDDEAFLVRKDGDAGDIFTVDTNNSEVTVDNAVITGGTNTFDITNGTASLNVAAGYGVDIDGNVDVDGDFTLTNDFTVTATNGGEIDFTAASKKLDIEDDSVVNQDLTTDADVTFNSVTTDDIKDSGANVYLSADGSGNIDSIGTFSTNIDLNGNNLDINTGNIIVNNGSDVTLSAAELAYLDNLDQNLVTTSDVEFNSLTIDNNEWLLSNDNAGTGTVNMFKVNTSDEIDTGATLNTGPIEFEADSGAITAMNLPVTSDASDGDEMSMTMSIDSNQILKVKASADGTGGADGLQCQSYGGWVRNTTTVNAATYDLVTTDDILLVTYTNTAAVTSLTLPTAQCVDGRTIVIKDAGYNANTNNITLDTEGSENINNAGTFTMDADGESITLVADGSDWHVISNA